MLAAGVRVQAPQPRCSMMPLRLQVFFWDLPAIMEFTTAFYSEHLALIEGYDVEVKKSDAARVLILHKLGGVYLDLDVQCLQCMDASLQGHATIFQVDRGQPLPAAEAV